MKLQLLSVDYKNHMVLRIETPAESNIFRKSRYIMVLYFITFAKQPLHYCMKLDYLAIVIIMAQDILHALLSLQSILWNFTRVVLYFAMQLFCVAAFNVKRNKILFLFYNKPLSTLSFINVPT